jgi:hypothetical protein
MLMFSVVVMLSSIVGAMVTGIGTPAQPPMVSLEFDFDDEAAGPAGNHDELVVEHDAGDGISGHSGTAHEGRVVIMSTVPFEDDTDPATSGCACSLSGSKYTAPLDDNPDDGFPGSTMYVGESIQLYTAEPDQDFDDAVVTIVWRSGNGKSSVLATWRGPGLPD